eukprot:4400862-Pleurochrysis_carterae.AAC.3
MELTPRCVRSSCGLDGHPCHGEDPTDPDSASAISTPDVAMEVAISTCADECRVHKLCELRVAYKRRA